jgi:hypothetical protein
MRTETIKIYKFEELSDEAQKKAVEDVQNDEHYLSYDWWDGVYEWFKDKYRDVFHDIEPSFSGFWSQGDGASFGYSGVDRDRILNLWLESEGFSPIRRKFYEEYLDIYAVGRRNDHRYVHENSVSHNIHFDLMYNNSVSGAYNVLDFVFELDCDFEYWFENYYKGICQELYRTLENDYDYLMSYEAIEEHCIANEYEYLEDGSRY